MKMKFGISLLLLSMLILSGCRPSALPPELPLISDEFLMPEATASPVTAPTSAVASTSYPTLYWLFKIGFLAEENVVLYQRSDSVFSGWDVFGYELHFENGEVLVFDALDDGAYAEADLKIIYMSGRKTLSVIIYLRCGSGCSNEELHLFDLETYEELNVPTEKYFWFDKFSVQPDGQAFYDGIPIALTEHRIRQEEIGRKTPWFESLGYAVGNDEIILIFESTDGEGLDYEETAITYAFRDGAFVPVAVEITRVED